MSSEEVTKDNELEDIEPKSVDALEKEIKKLKRSLKREQRAIKAAENLEKEQREHRREFEEITDVSMIYVTTDKDLKIIEVSKAFCDMFGYTKDELIGQNYDIFINLKEAQKFYNGCEYVSTHHHESFGTNIKLVDKSGEMLFTHTFIYPLMESGVVRGFTFVSQDTHYKTVFKKYKINQLAAEKYDETTVEFMKSTSSAILNTVNSKVSIVVKILTATIVFFFIASIVFDIEEIVKGEGTVIPSYKLQKIKNLEAGIVSEINVKEGDRVQVGQILIRVDDASTKTKEQETTIRLAELYAKKIRLEAQANLDKEMQEDFQFAQKYPKIWKSEQSLFHTSKKELRSKINKLREQLLSKESLFDDIKNAFLIDEENYLSIQEELDESYILEKKGVFSKYDIALKERESNDAFSKLISTKEKRNQTRNSINEIKNSIKEAKLNFQNKAKEEYSLTTSEISKLKETLKNIQEMIKRTYIKAPVAGIVQSLSINTIGSAISSAEELLTIVPDNGAMISEIKISPENIGKLYVGQAIKLKVSAYDYALYGNLDGKIINISPDTTTDKQTGQTYYLIKVKTKKNYLDNNKKYKLKVGMIVTTDILVGKKSILSFILKPILKSTQKD